MQAGSKIFNNRHWVQLDGIRGIAILMVICYHYFPQIAAFKYGWVGVDLFFVLSGFLITSRLLPFIHDKIILRKFYWNRFLRIVPLYFTFLIVFFLAWFFLSQANVLASFPFYTNHWAEFFIFIQNWTFIYHYPFSPDYLSHLWSLAIEEQFYLAFPFLILVFKKPKKIAWVIIILIAVIILSRCLYYSHHSIGLNGNFQDVYWNSFFRIDGLLAGALLFITLNYLKLPNFFSRLFDYLALALLLGSVLGIYLFSDTLMSFPFFETVGFTMISILFCYLLFKSLEAKNKYLIQFASSKWLGYIGKISFCLYVLHWPIYLVGFSIVSKLLSLAHIQSVSSYSLHTINVCFSLIASFIISHLSFVYFEAYFLKWKSQYVKAAID